MAENKMQIFLWYGDNDFEIHEQLSAWRRVFEKKYTGLNVISIDPTGGLSREQLTKEIKNALQVDTLFGANKLIIFNNYFDKTAKIAPELQDLKLRLLDNLSTSFFVVYKEKKKPDARGVVFKKLQSLAKKKLAEIKEFELPKQDQLVKWVLVRAKKYDLEMTPEAIKLMTALVGGDLWQMDNELKKLRSYVGGARKIGEEGELTLRQAQGDNGKGAGIEQKIRNKVGKEEVNLLVKGKYNDNIFQLMDAISERDKVKALRLFQDQLDSGANEMYLLTMLLRQFRIFLQIKELTAGRTMSDSEVATTLKIHPFVAKKSLHYLRGFSLEQLRKLFKDLLQFEIRIKGGKGEMEMMFDLLIAKL